MKQKSTVKLRKEKLIEQKKAEQEEVRRKKRRQRILFLNATFKSAEGKRTLRFLMELCGYQKPSVVINNENSDVATMSTVYNEARRNLYLEVRDYIKPSILKDVELEPLIEEE